MNRFDTLIDAVTSWNDAMQPTDCNFTQHFALFVPTAPIIGYTPGHPLRHRFWQGIAVIGCRLQRFARFEEHEDDDIGTYYLKRHWDWVMAARGRAYDAEPKPISDPNWVPPKPEPVMFSWGPSTRMQIDDASRKTKLQVEHDMLFGPRSRP